METKGSITKIEAKITASGDHVVKVTFEIFPTNYEELHGLLKKPLKITLVSDQNERTI